MRTNKKAEDRPSLDPKLKIIIFVVIAAAAGYIIKNIQKNSYPESPVTKVKERLIKVDVRGAVNKPGIYRIRAGQNLGYIIGLAQGLKKKADIKRLDFSDLIRSDCVVSIPVKKSGLGFGHAPEETYIMETIAIKKED